MKKSIFGVVAALFMLTSTTNAFGWGAPGPGPGPGPGGGMAAAVGPAAGAGAAASPGAACANRKCDDVKGQPGPTRPKKNLKAYLKAKGRL